MQNGFAKYDFVLINEISDFNIAKGLFIEYAESLKIDLCFQDFEKELNEIYVQYQKPSGGLILIKHVLTGEYMGCIGIRKLEGNIAELKRMYIRDDHRNKGLGKHLLNLAVYLAKELKYEKIRLDTLAIMKPAIKLYQAKGFKEIGSYRYNPRPDVIFFELDLK
jgi:GNAT superfamily N-acetyltransferase